MQYTLGKENLIGNSITDRRTNNKKDRLNRYRVATYYINILFLIKKKEYLNILQ